MPTHHSPYVGMVAFVYRHVLHRDATPPEIADWAAEMGRGLSFDDLVGLVSTSDEAASVGEAELDASVAAVGNLFSIALDRKPTLVDVAGWSEQLRRGRSLASFIDEILDSPEARSRYGRPQLELEQDAIAFVHRHALGREPTESDLSLWSRRLHEGLSFPTFLREVQTGAEGWRRANGLTAQTGAESVAFVYRHVLGRAPTDSDTEEWCEHLRSGLSFQGFLRAILTSEEARHRSAVDVEPPNGDDFAFVYRHGFHREPTAGDWQAWTQHLSTGAPFRRFLLDIVASEEDEAQDGTTGTVGDVITFAYHYALGREPTESDTALWAQHLRKGLSFPRFIALVAGSDEARARSMPSSEDSFAEAIAFTYRHALGREPTESDLALWAQHLRKGLSFPRFIALVAGSDEARARSMPSSEDSFAEAIAFTYRHALGREPTESDLALWTGHFRNGLSFPRFLAVIAGSDEARARGAGEKMPEGLFIAHLYEICFGRCALPSEIEEWKRRFVEHRYQKADVAMSFIAAAIRDSDEQGDAGAHDGAGSVLVMGTNRTLNAEGWQARGAEIKAGRNLVPRAPLSAPYVIRPHTIRVSAIASLYKGGRYIRKFLDNMTQQSLGENFELIIVDANSPDGERDVIEQYRKSFSNIRYERVNYRIGIYDAWNLGVDMARGDYLTNTNLDDLRRRDSLELQAETLDAVRFADVVYQDFFYTLDPEMTFEQVEAYGFKSFLPLVTPNNLLSYNPPHNAPMWRKRLHSELGLFDTSMKSAGDHEFWLRCLQAGKIFYKINTPHVVYYQNPDGISTRPGSAGLVEGKRIQRRYGRKLISPDLYLDREALKAKLDSASGCRTDGLEGGPTYERIQRLILSLADGTEPRLRSELSS